MPFAIDVAASSSWYGQSIVTWDAELTAPTDETYFGYQVHRNWWSRHIFVPAITIEKAAEGLECIDLIDADLQGAETELLPWMDLLTAKVQLIHIGTHGIEIEAALREAFLRYGWICHADYSLQGERETPFGPIRFDDGVQAWRNPRL